jgi:hypothetical protein
LTRSFPLPKSLSGWKLKIRNKETTEPPHISILKGTQCWRYGLRERAFLDKRPKAKDVRQEILDYIEEHYQEIVDKWNETYPLNPV